MANKLATEFAVPTDEQVANGTFLWVLSDPTTGKLYKPTNAHHKAVMQGFKTKYTTTGSEGSTLTIAALANKEILAVYKEGQVLYEVDEDPDEQEFTWDDTDIVLGQAIDRANMRFLILYKTK
jgi:hypothetical protein